MSYITIFGTTHLNHFSYDSLIINNLFVFYFQPQSQINKCNNEKRRRELENNYIEQLSEFLQLNKRGDMTSTKPDKAAILNQVVKTVSI